MLKQLIPVVDRWPIFMRVYIRISIEAGKPVVQFSRSISNREGWVLRPNVSQQADCLGGQLMRTTRQRPSRVKVAHIRANNIRCDGIKNPVNPRYGFSVLACSD